MLGWKNVTNGRLLAGMEGRFDLLVTADKNIYSQQNFFGRSISVLVLPTNRRNDVMAMGSQIAAVVDTISAGEYLVLETTGELTRRTFR